MANPKGATPLLVLATIAIAVPAYWGSTARGAEDEPPLLSPVYALPPERVETHVLARGETLDRVLGRASITGGELANLLLTLREFANPRRLQAGSRISIHRWLDDGQARAIELRLNPDTAVRLDRTAFGWGGRFLLTPVTVDTVWVAGTIDHGQSLYQALADHPGLDLPARERVALVVELAEIYGYRLDFSREIQPGDAFRFVYERESRPDGTARGGRILVAEVRTGGRAFPAIHFRVEGESAGYYDAEGKALRTAFRRYPVDYVRITSAFSWRRYHPILGVHRAHLGTDFGAPTGTPVRATADGSVVSAGWNGGYGNLIVLNHPGGYSTKYAHLSRIAAGTRPGRRVQEGQIIGYVGATGLATGPHLHYELWRGNQALDPRSARLPTAPPIPPERMPEFETIVAHRIAILDEIAPGPQFARIGSGSEPFGEEL